MVNKFEAIGIAISIGALVLALFLIRVETTNDNLALSDTNSQSGAVFVADSENQSAAVADAVIEAANGSGDIQRLIIDDVIIGDGDGVFSGSTVTVHYIGTLQNGQQFDNSYLKGSPFSFTIGEGKVIKGWEQGVVGMREGGQRILVIPPELAYGSDGFGPIPSNATLVFAIELLSVDE